MSSSVITTRDSAGDRMENFILFELPSILNYWNVRSTIYIVTRTCTEIIDGKKTSVTYPPITKVVKDYFRTGTLTLLGKLMALNLPARDIGLTVFSLPVDTPSSPWVEPNTQSSSEDMGGTLIPEILPSDPSSIAERNEMSQVTKVDSLNPSQATPIGATASYLLTTTSTSAVLIYDALSQSTFRDSLTVESTSLEFYCVGISAKDLRVLISNLPLDYAYKAYLMNIPDDCIITIQVGSGRSSFIRQ